jgi:hypothetical protein
MSRSPPIRKLLTIANLRLLRPRESFARFPRPGLRAFDNQHDSASARSDGSSVLHNRCAASNNRETLVKVTAARTSDSPARNVGIGYPR